MTNINKLITGALVVLAVPMLSSCLDDSDGKRKPSTYFVGIEAASDPTTDVLSYADSLIAGVISPVNNGFEQPAWMTFLQGKDQIIVSGYTSAPQFTSYELVDGQLVEGGSLFIDETPYAYDIVNASTMVLTTSPRGGLSNKKIIHIDTDNMTILNTVSTNYGDIAEDSLLAFPTDMIVRNNKLFISYNHIHADGSFATPASNVARIAVFTYPELEFEKLIEDDRAANIGRYYGTNALEMDEDGNIYTYSPSALACGYNPIPENNSAILRIKSGETDFDEDYYIDFETLSGGYKINAMIYSQNGKAVLRVFQEDENNAAYLWGTYAPLSETPILATGVIDLKNQSFKLLENVPLGGGGWNAAYLVEGSTVHLGISNSGYAGIYQIDTEAGTASQGATIDGNYAKGILSLK